MSVPMTLTAYSLSDAYLTVDTNEWIADRVSGEREDLTESFTAFLAEQPYGQDYAGDDSIVAWLKATYPGAEISGLYGEGEQPWSAASCNYDTFLDNDVSLALVHVKRDETTTTDDIGREIGNGDEVYLSLLIETGRGYMATHRPTVYDFNGDDDGDALDWACAWGGCSNGHNWSCDDTVSLYFDGGSMGTPPRIDECIAAPLDAYGEPDIARAYLACPAVELRYGGPEISRSILGAYRPAVLPYGAVATRVTCGAPMSFDAS